MTADQAHCLLLPPTFAVSVLCVVVHVFVVGKCFVGVRLENLFVFVAQCSRTLHIKQSNTSPFINIVQCATANGLIVSSMICTLKFPKHLTKKCIRRKKKKEMHTNIARTLVFYVGI